MKKITLVIAVVSLLAIAHTGIAVARGGDQGDRGSQRRDLAERTDRVRGGDRAAERRRDRPVAEQRRPDRDLYDRVDRRQDRQRARIRDGRESGTLTRKETRLLRRDQKKITRLERRFERDGFLNKRERRVLNRAQDRASDRIYRAKHNDRNRGDRRGWGWGRGYDRDYKPYRQWRRGSQGHHHHQPVVEEQVVYAPTGSSSLAFDVQFEGITLGWSKTKQF